MQWQVWGDNVVGITFSGEDETVLFSPKSGDILACRSEDWLSLFNPSGLDASLPSQLKVALIELGLAHQ